MMMMEWRDEGVELLQEKALFLPRHQALVLADVHLGKVNHFRRAGIPVPPRANRHTAELLVQLLLKYRPARVIFLGDLFHSHYNEAWEEVAQIRDSFPAVSFDLVRGNHDVLSQHQYERCRLALHSQLVMGNWCFTHDPADAADPACYQVAGHIHPAARLRGAARQSLTLPCFWWGSRCAVLPAFGAFTGVYPVTPQKGDRLFVVAPDRVVEIKDVSYAKITK